MPVQLSSLIVASIGTAVLHRDERFRHGQVSKVQNGHSVCLSVSTKSGRSWSQLSSSGVGEDTVLAYTAQWAEETELREENKRLKNEGSEPSVQFE